MKKVTFLLAAMLFVSQAVFSQNKTTENSKQNMQNDKDSLSYSFGLLIAKNLKGQGLDSLNYDQVIEGMKGAFNGDSKMTPQQADAFIKQYMQKAANEKAMKNLEEGKKFLAENGKRKGVTTTASGLQYEVVVHGIRTKTRKCKYECNGTLSRNLNRRNCF
jgi:FKBP-type peptidyl-prolyl cis-trans isomerase FklB